MTWQQIPVRRVFRIVNGGTPTSDENYWDGDVPWATPVDIGAVDGRYLSSTQRSLTEDGVLAGSRTVPSGALILSTRAPIGYVAQTTARTAFNQGCRGLVPLRSLDLRFFRYQFLGLRDELTARGAGATFMELSTDALAGVPLENPDVDEQHRIADFLDGETARIDTVVSQRLMQIERLDERDKAWRSQLFALSKSGAPTRVKHLLRSRPRYGVLVPKFVDAGIPFIRVNNLPGLTNRERLALIPEELSAQYRRTVTEVDDVLVSVVGTVGRTAVVTEDVAGANTARAVAVLRLKRNYSSSLFATWVGTADFERQALLATGADSAQPTLGMEDLANFAVCWPTDPLEEKTMAEAAEDQRSIAATVRTSLDRQLGLLAEWRKALITAAVTGQIDVTTAGRFAAAATSPSGNVA